MGRSISLFSGYEQRENRTTNYILLVLKLVYDESPSLLAEVLSSLTGQDLGEAIGVQFRQQERKAGSVPDGLIFQQAFSLYIETKETDWFYDHQLLQHLRGLVESGPGLRVLLALANFEEDDLDRFSNIEQAIQQDYAGQAVFAAATFEDLLRTLQTLPLSSSLSDTVGDFAAYLDDAGLLPSWKTRLDVVNCVSTGHEIAGGVYLCPTEKGAYQHKRARYFGEYREKAVRQVAQIEAVVDLASQNEETLRWINGGMKRANAIHRARELHAQFRPGAFPHRVFVLGSRYETIFRKDTKGGMLGSKQYFTVDAEDAQSLAEKLRNHFWSTWKA